jgi:hypothetical protein
MSMETGQEAAARARRLYRRKLMAEAAASGLSQRAFCREQGIAEPLFLTGGGCWRKKKRGWRSGRAAGCSVVGGVWI